MEPFKVAISGDFMGDDGIPLFPEFDLTWLDLPNVTYFTTSKGDDILAAEIEDADALILNIPRFSANSVPKSGRLALIARFGVGFDNVDIPVCTENKIGVAIAPAGVRRPMAMAYIQFLMALASNIIPKDRMARNVPDGWNRKGDFKGMGLAGRTLGALGVGNIGSEIFRIAATFGMRFIACDPFADPAHAARLGVQLVDMETLFRESDFLCVVCPLNDETRGLVDAHTLALMKPSAFLINGARGPIVDQAALTRVLMERRIAGAALDVMEKEPPDADDPLLGLDNVILAPHTLCYTDALFEGLGSTDVKAVLDVMHGRPPETMVNAELKDDPAWMARLDAYRKRFGEGDQPG
jgi:phosphoglycerate dehydrogenase-like enzyme